MRRLLSRPLVISYGVGIVLLLIPIVPHALRQSTLQDQLHGIDQTAPGADERRRQLETQLFITTTQWDLRLILAGLALVLPALVVLVASIQRTNEMVSNLPLLETFAKVGHLREELAKIIEHSQDHRIADKELNAVQISFLRDRLKGDYDAFLRRLETINNKFILIDGKLAILFDEELMRRAQCSILASANVERPEDSFWSSLPGEDYWSENRKTIENWDATTAAQYAVPQDYLGCKRVFIISKADVDRIKIAIAASKLGLTKVQQELLEFVEVLRKQQAGGVEVRIAIRQNVTAVDLLIVDGWIASKTTQQDNQDGRQFEIEVKWNTFDVAALTKDWDELFYKNGISLAKAFA